MSTRYTVDESHTVYEVLNNEAVIINLDSGFYYFLNKPATDIWQAIAGGANVDETVELLRQSYTGDARQMQEAVRTLLNELLQEKFLIPTQSAAMTAPTIVDDVAGIAAAKILFEQPTIVKHTDLDNVLQIEPIGGYDEAGWPTRRRV